RNAGHGITQKVTREQEQLEVEQKPRGLGPVVPQRDQEGTSGGEPGGIVIGQKVVLSQSIGLTVPAVLVLNPRLKRLVVRALARGKELAGRPVTDIVWVDLLPGRDRP